MVLLNLLQQLAHEGAASTQGYALTVGEPRNYTTHVVNCHFFCSPLAVEMIRDIGRLQGQRLGIPPSETTLTFSKGYLSHCGVGMPDLGLRGFLFGHLRWMGSFDILSPLLLLCPVYYCFTYYLAY